MIGRAALVLGCVACACADAAFAQGFQIRSDAISSSGVVGAAPLGSPFRLSMTVGQPIIGAGQQEAGALWRDGIGFWYSTRPPILSLLPPRIVSILDVPNDQGGRVSIRWLASVLDRAPGNTIDEYWIWRQVPGPYAPPSGAEVVKRGATSPRPIRSTSSGTTTYFWEFVSSQVAHGFPAYSFTAPTLFDSLPGSNPYTLFMVEAERPSTGEYWSSDPDSGYSVDNLAPAPPAPFTATYFGGATHLHWGISREADFAVYRLYRGVTSDFVPGPGNLVAAKPDTGHVDSGPAGGFYKLSAVDVHGNESLFSRITPSTTTGAPDGHPAPLALSIDGPNPVRGSTQFRFGLPRSESVTLAIYDATGRQIRMLGRGTYPAGEHFVPWDGRDAARRTLESGVYFVQLQTAGASRVVRFTWLR